MSDQPPNETERGPARAQYGPAEPLNIVMIFSTCPSHPSQWEGETYHGATVYVRYRSNALRVHVGPGVDDAIERDPVFTLLTEPGFSADEITFEELRALLPGWISLPAQESPWPPTLR